MSRGLVAYLVAKAVLLAMILEPPMRGSQDRSQSWKIEIAQMDFINARDALAQ